VKTRALGLLVWATGMTLALLAMAGNDVAGTLGDSVGERHPENPRNVARSGTQARLGSASPLVFPRRQFSLPAAHRVHAEKTKLGCLDCHSNAATSNASSDWLGPSNGRCVECHAQKFDGIKGESAPNPRLRFSHLRHANKGIRCEACHGQVNEADDARGSERLPLMAVCLRCHRSPNVRAKASTDCRSCHFSRGGVLQTRFKEGLLVPSNSLGAIEHSGNWLYRHGDAAMNQGKLCSSCHEESECMSCHNSPLRPRAIHPSDWLTLHGIEARQSGSSCVSCHRSQSECLTCHLRAGLSPSGPQAREASRARFHPPPSVWTDRPRTGRHHAVQARLHLDECVSCHQERDCAACHATAGVGGPGVGSPWGSGISPHPRGFGAQCTGILAKNPRPCIACHRADDPMLVRCR